MQRTEERRIGEHTYSITQFSGTKGLKMFTRLVKLIGEPAAMMFDKGESEMSGEVLAPMIKALASNIDESIVENLVKDLLEGVRCDGKEIQFDIHFAGNFGELFSVIRAVLEVQYGNFLSGLAAAAAPGAVTHRPA